MQHIFGKLTASGMRKYTFTFAQMSRYNALILFLRDCATYITTFYAWTEKILCIALYHVDKY